MSVDKTAEYWIEKLNLKVHPEGGYFSEIYRSGEIIKQANLPIRYSGNRCFSTSIYYLIPGNKVSKFHRIKSDEIWHFYSGSPITVHIIDCYGKYKKIQLGQNPDENQNFQMIIEKGNWFGATIDDKNSFSLIGCTVSPGFDFEDFELGVREDLIKLFPENKEIIEILT